MYRSAIGPGLDRRLRVSDLDSGDGHAGPRAARRHDLLVVRLAAQGAGAALGAQEALEARDARPARTMQTTPGWPVTADQVQVLDHPSSAPR